MSAVSNYGLGAPATSHFSGQRQGDVMHTPRRSLTIPVGTRDSCQSAMSVLKAGEELVRDGKVSHDGTRVANVPRTSGRSVSTHDDGRPFHHAGLFLDAARVRKEEGALGSQAQERLVANRRHHLDAASPCSRGRGPRMCLRVRGCTGKARADRAARDARGGRGGRYRRRFRGGGTSRGRRRPATSPSLSRGLLSPREWGSAAYATSTTVFPVTAMRSCRDALGEEVVPRLLGGCQAEVRQVVGDDAVVLLRHAPVEAAQPGLDVDQGNLQGIGRQRPAQSRVGVALHDHERRAPRRRNALPGAAPVRQSAALGSARRWPA